MARTRLACVLVTAALAASGLVPAAAAPAAPRLGVLDPARAVHDAALALAADPSVARLETWRRALLSSASPESSPREWVFTYDVGDVDGDRRSDVALMAEDGTAVRSGRDGRVLLRRERSSLLPVTGAGPVRLVAVDVDYRESAGGYSVERRLAGLGRAGEVLWEHVTTGSVDAYGLGPAYAGRFDGFPAMLHDGLRAPDGRPQLMLGALTGATTPAGTASRLDLQLLSVADGSTTTLPGVVAAGAGLPWAFPSGGCHTTTAPVATLTAVSLFCDGASRWSSTVDLRDPYVVPAGDFDADRASDLMLTTFSFDDEAPGGPGFGTRVLAYADGTELAAAEIDGLTPLGADVSGDGQPDFLEMTFENAGFGVRGVTLAGQQLWKRSVELRGSGSLEGYLGLDVTGDGLGDAFLRAEPQRGTPMGLVINGRDGRMTRVPGVDALLAPGLRARGADLAVFEPVGGRLRARVLSGDRGRTLLDTRLPGPADTPAYGGAAAADLDGDGRRDLVVVARTGDRRTATGVSSTGRVLWQQSETAVLAGASGEVVVVGGRS